MQQYLPLAVLKHCLRLNKSQGHSVATVLTACGIETRIKILLLEILKCTVATVLTACGIETKEILEERVTNKVATVLTACGIETDFRLPVLFRYGFGCNSTYRLRY